MLVQEANSHIVLGERPVFFDVHSSLGEIEVKMKGGWNGLAVKLSNSSQSGLNSLVTVRESSWEIEEDIRIDSVAVSVLIS